jgi:hypothetical protein
MSYSVAAEDTDTDTATRLARRYSYRIAQAHEFDEKI